MTKIQQELFALQDEKYQSFQGKLVPNIDAQTIIGVRVPQLRTLAKQLYRQKEDYNIEDFFTNLPHAYYEETLLHSFLIEQIKDFDECMAQFEKFLPFIDNWAVCDTCHPKVFKKHSDVILQKAKAWVKDSEPYTIRYGISCFMCYFLDGNFDTAHFDHVCAVTSDEYYVKMMQAWYFATALAKQWQAAVKIIEEKRLSPWVHNKTIQKACESFRVTDEHKIYLRTLKV